MLVPSPQRGPHSAERARRGESIRDRRSVRSRRTQHGHGSDSGVLRPGPGACHLGWPLSPVSEAACEVGSASGVSGASMAAAAVWLSAFRSVPKLEVAYVPHFSEGQFPSRRPQHRRASGSSRIRGEHRLGLRRAPIAIPPGRPPRPPSYGVALACGSSQHRRSGRVLGCDSTSTASTSARSGLCSTGSTKWTL